MILQGTFPSIKVDKDVSIRNFASLGADKGSEQLIPHTRAELAGIGIHFGAGHRGRRRAADPCLNSSLLVVRGRLKLPAILKTVLDVVGVGETKLVPAPWTDPKWWTAVWRTERLLPNIQLRVLGTGLRTAHIIELYVAFVSLLSV